MQTIQFRYEQDVDGKKDLIEKTVDMDYQAGSSCSSNGLQEYNTLSSIAFSLYDFLNRVGFGPDSMFIIMEKVFKDLSEEETLPEPNLIPTDSELNYESFVKRFNDSEEFRERMFQLFQMYMTGED